MPKLIAVLIDRADGDSAAAKIIHPAGVHEVPVFDDRAGSVDGAAVEVGYRASDDQSAAGLVSQLPARFWQAPKWNISMVPVFSMVPQLSSRLTNMLIRPELMILAPVRFAKPPSPP